MGHKTPIYFFFLPGAATCLQLYLILSNLNEMSSIAVFSSASDSEKEFVKAHLNKLSRVIKLETKTANRSPSDWAFIMEQDRV